jgi:asparagine synthase (glutamine-hydrolysing)
MLLGGWGERALALLDAAHGTRLERVGRLAVVGAEGAGEGGWRCWLSGRLGNAAELGAELGLPGAGATALATAAHERSGPAAIDLLRGSFVLVAADRERERASVARDHLGGRPLVHVRVGDGVLFAEHEHQLLEVLPSVPGPDRLALWHWLERGGIPPGRTLYEGICRVPPGHRLLLSSAGVELERYWAPSYDGTISGSREEIAGRLREEAFAAIDRAAGEERIGVRLSGGLDSACVAAGLATRGGADGALALAAVFPGQPETDERTLIEATAEHTGLALEQVRFEGEPAVLGPALRHLERWRLPPGSPNLFVWDELAALARQRGVVAMLDGEGGDELFGLAPYLIADALAAGRPGRAWSLAGAIPGIGERPAARLRLRALRVFGIGGLVPTSARRWRRRRAASRDGASLLPSPALLALAEIDPSPSAAGLDGPRWWRSLAADLAAGGEAFDVSAQLRRQAVAGGVDGRHPFLFDRDLVEAVLASPPQLQFDPVRDRALLREGLRGRIPEQVRGRYAKSRFTPLLVGALAGAEGEWAAGLLADREAPIRAYLRESSLELLLARRGTRTSPAEALRLWRVIAADAWLRSLGG